MEKSKMKPRSADGAPVFLRDLSKSQHEDFLSRWETDQRKDLLRAHKKGDDITVGYYLDRGEEFVW